MGLVIGMVLVMVFGKRYPRGNDELNLCVYKIVLNLQLIFTK